MLIKLYKKKAPQRIKNFLLTNQPKPYLWVKNVVYREKKKYFGRKNPDITFYVVRTIPQYTGAGLASIYLHVLGHIIIALERNLIPVVDMENYKTHYNEEDLINNTKNSWEYYFKQPSDYSLSEVYESKSVILSSLDFPRKTIIYQDLNESSGLVPLLLDDEKVRVFHDYIVKNILLNESTYSYITEKTKSIILKDRKILGVAARGTDYTSLRPKGHHIQPSVEHLIEMTAEKVVAWNIDYIFLMTEETTIIERFEQAFSDKVLTAERYRHTDFNSESFVMFKSFERENDKYNTGLEYLTEIVILSQCHYFLGAISGGVVVAMFMNGGRYEGKHIIDLGLYP